MNNMDKNADSYEELANNFLYLKEVNFEAFNNKEYFTKYNEILQDLNKINHKLLSEEGEMLVDKVRVIFILFIKGFLSILKGIIETFERWLIFLILFEKVDKANFFSKSHPKNFNLSLMNKEYQKIMDMKTTFIKTFSKEISEFCNNNKEIYYVIIEDFKVLLNYVNTNVFLNLN